MLEAQIAAEPLPIEAPLTWLTGATACTHLRLLVSYQRGEARGRLDRYSAARVCALGSGDMPRARL